MITIMLAVRSKNGRSSLGDLLKSLAYNASSKDNYEVLIKLDEDDPHLDALQETIKGHDVNSRVIISPRGKGYGDLHKAYMDLLLIANPSSKLYWVLSDDVLILGSHWDRYLLHHEEHNKIGKEFVIIPTTMVDYNSQTPEMALNYMDNYPVWSRSWILKTGFGYTFSTDGWTNLILRSLYVNHKQDRRIFVRQINVVRSNSPEDFEGSERWNTTRAQMIENVLSPQGQVLVETAVSNLL